MNAELLLRHYERIAEAPNAIARLRRFILDLAVRGKLVEQDADEEPASALLKRISAERARLVKVGEIRRPKPFPAIDDPAFDLPDSWAWVAIREITSDRGQQIPNAPITYIDVTAINKEAGIVAEPKVLQASEAPSRARKITQKGDVIYSCVRPYLLNVAVIEQDFDPTPIASTAFAVLNGYGLVLPRYIWIVLRTPYMVECVEATQRGQAYPAINDADFAVLPFPLPPLAEQHRIIAKVDELMALCDLLETAQAERETGLTKLTLSTLVKLNEPDPETFADDARFALDHLESLTKRTDQIKQLKQTILNLAVRGKLVTSEVPVKQGVLGQAGKFVSGNGFPKQFQGKADGKIPFLKVSDMNIAGNERQIRSANNYVSSEDLHSMRAKAHPAGTVIFPKIGGAIATNKRRILACASAIDNNCAGQVPNDEVNVDWLYLVLSSIDMAAYQAGTAVPALNMKRLAEHPIAIPPIKEQHRIVAKVDELLALCDQLEASLVEGEQTRSKLLEAVLHDALEPA